MNFLIVLLLVSSVWAKADPKAEAKAEPEPKAAAKPDYPAPAPAYGAPPKPSYGPPPSNSYGPPKPTYGPPPKPVNSCPKKCYDKVLYTTVTKTAMEHHTHWNTYDQVRLFYNTKLNSSV